MPRRKKQCRLQAYKMNAFIGSEVADYSKLFYKLAELTPIERQYKVRDTVYAIPEMEVIGNTVRLVAFSGNVNQQLFILNTTTAEAYQQDLKRDQAIVNPTIALVSLDSRCAVIEYNFYGPKASHIEGVIVNSMEKYGEWSDLNFDFVPLVARSFSEEIMQLETIKAPGFLFLSQIRLGAIIQISSLSWRRSQTDRSLRQK